MEKFERKFIVDSEGKVEEKGLSEEEKAQLNDPEGKKKLITLEEDRQFIVSTDGTTEIVGEDTKS